MQTHTSRASPRGHKIHADPVAPPPANDANRNILLDMIELLGEERRRDEYQAISSRDASSKTTLEIAARHCAATISDLRRRLGPARDSTQRQRIRKRQVDACLANMLDTCFVPGPTEPARGVLNGGIPSGPPRHAAET